MGYFDALASSAFKETKSGRMAFYPWGRFGRGYEIPTEERHQELRRVVIRYYMMMLPAIVVAVVWRNWIAIAAVVTLLILFYAVKIRGLTRGLPATEEKLTFKDSYEAQARRHNPIMLWAMLIGSLLLTVGGAFMLRSPDRFLIGLLSVALFGACTLAFAWMLVARRRLLRQADPEKARVFD